VNAAVKQLAQLAADHQMTTAQLALAWCAQVDGVTSTIIGATTLKQLEDNIAAFDFDLSDELLAEMDKVLRSYPMPF